MGIGYIYRNEIAPDIFCFGKVKGVDILGCGEGDDAGEEEQVE